VGKVKKTVTAFFNRLSGARIVKKSVYRLGGSEARRGLKEGKGGEDSAAGRGDVWGAGAGGDHFSVCVNSHAWADLGGRVTSRAGEVSRTVVGFPSSA
jgi:hypothetical protein